MISDIIVFSFDDFGTDGKGLCSSFNSFDIISEEIYFSSESKFLTGVCKASESSRSGNEGGNESTKELSYDCSFNESFSTSVCVYD